LCTGSPVANIKQSKINVNKNPWVGLALIYYST